MPLLEISLWGFTFVGLPDGVGAEVTGLSDCIISSQGIIMKGSKLVLTSI